MKEKCNCGKIAVWYYTPGYSGDGNPYKCDDCVHRGCECNYNYVDEDGYDPPLNEKYLPTDEDKPFKWINDKVWVHLDDKGREYPCCEYWYDKNGFDVDENLD